MHPILPAPRRAGGHRCPASRPRVVGCRCSPSTVAHLDHVLATAQRDGRLPSVAAGLVRGGELVWSGAAGTVDGRADGRRPDADTQYRMGSITKTFVAVCVLRLRDAGRLELTDRFGAHVPGSALDDVTVEQLLTHAAGTQAETPGPWWERTPGGDWDALVASPVGQRFRAGRRFHYSNVGLRRARAACSRWRHGRGWFEVVRDELLEPLGMTRTTHATLGVGGPGARRAPVRRRAAARARARRRGDGARRASCGPRSTDLARWATFLGGDTAGLLSADTLAEMVEPHHVVDDPGQPWVAAHGLGFQVWNVDGARFAGHGGSMPGFLAGLRVRLDAGVPVGSSAAGRERERRHGIRPGQRRGGRRGRAVHQHHGVHGDAVGRRRAARRAGPPRAGPGRGVVGGRRPRAARARGHLALGTRDGDRHGWPASTSCSVSRAPGGVHGSGSVATDEWVGLDSYYAGEPLRVVRRGDGSVSHLDLASFRFTRTPYDPQADVPGGVDERGWT